MDPVLEPLTVSLVQVWRKPVTVGAPVILAWNAKVNSVLENVQNWKHDDFLLAALNCASTVDVGSGARQQAEKVQVLFCGNLSPHAVQLC